MKHQPTQSITSLPVSPDEERRARMIKYSIMMGIRVVCIFALLFAQGWWILVFAAGAIFLPYFAVIVANVGTSRRGDEVVRPGGLVPVQPTPPTTVHDDPPTDGDAPAADGDARAADGDPRFRSASDDPREARPEGDAA